MFNFGVILVVSIFDDGRFNEQRSTTYTSYIEYITCSNSKAGDLSQCHVIDGCEVSCNNPIAIKCFGNHNYHHYHVSVCQHIFWTFKFWILHFLFSK